jgi:hypothetical protein
MKSLVGERRAVAAALLAFYGFLYFLVSQVSPPEIKALLLAHAGLYGLAFFGLVAGWFWGRWYASGMAMYGLVTGVFGMFQMGPEPILVFIAVTHGVMAIVLVGEHMAAGFDGRPEWRARFHLDEPAVERLGKSVTRAAMSLPFLLAWALAPKNPGQGALLALAPLALGAAGLWALVRMRTWGVLALAGAGVGAAGIAATTPGPTPLVALVAAGLMALAVAPFGAPIVRHLRGHLGGAAR